MMMPTNIWESAFVKNQVMWGFQPALAAERACAMFSQQQHPLPEIRNVLIPGFGYGRNAVPFLQHQMTVAGIEIAPTAIALGREKGIITENVTVHEGSVSDMPYDNVLYDGIFCHGTIYLLDEPGRNKFLADCYRQLIPGGQMVFTAISKDAPMYGQGPCLGKDCYERFPGMSMFFYDENSVVAEFGPYGLVSQEVIEEPQSGQQQLPFIYITCHKK